MMNYNIISDHFDFVGGNFDDIEGASTGKVKNCSFRRLEMAGKIVVKSCNRIEHLIAHEGANLIGSRVALLEVKKDLDIQSSQIGILRFLGSSTVIKNSEILLDLIVEPFFNNMDITPKVHLEATKVKKIQFIGKEGEVHLKGLCDVQDIINGKIIYSSDENI